LIVRGIKTKLLEPGEDLVSEITSAMKAQGIDFDDGDILAVASKAVSVTQNRVVKLDSVKPSKRAIRIAKKYGMRPSYVEIILQESNGVYGGVWKALLTLKDKLFVPNAGIDFKNAPEGHVALWPKNSHRTAEEIRRSIVDGCKKKVGVLIVDSQVTPLRRGTVGVAIGIAGIQPVRDCRGERDLYGRRIQITTHAVADDLASAAHLVMGETTELTPAVLIKGAPVEVVEQYDPESIYMPPDECLYGHILMRLRKKS